MSENLSVTNLQMVGDRLTDILDLNRRRDADDPSTFDTDRAPDSVVKEELKNLSMEYPNETKAAAQALKIAYLLPEDDSLVVSPKGFEEDTLIGDSGDDPLTEEIVNEPTVMRRGVVPEFLVGKAKEIQEQGLKRPLLTETITPDQRKAYDDYLEAKGRFGPPTQIGATKTELALETDYGFFPRTDVDPTGMMGTLDQPMMSGDPLTDIQRSDLSSLLSGNINEKILKGLKDPASKKRGIIEQAGRTLVNLPSALFAGEGAPLVGEKDTATEAGILGGVEELVNLAFMGAREVPRSIAGAGYVAANPSAIANDLIQVFSTSLMEMPEGKRDFTSPILFMEGRRDINNQMITLADYMQDSLRQALNMDSEASFKRYYKNIRGLFEVDLAETNFITKAASITGLMSAPYAGIRNLPVMTSIALRNYNRSVVASHVAKLVGKKKAFEDVLKKQVYNLDPAATSIPAPFYRILADKDGESLEYYVNKFQRGGMSREKAIERTLETRRDLVAAAVSGLMYGIFDYSTKDDSIATGMSFIGALTGNSLVKYGRVSASAGLFKIAGLLGIRDRTEMNKALQAFKDSDVKGITPYRRTFLNAQGISGGEQKNAVRMSLQRGNEALLDLESMRKQNKNESTIEAKRQKYIAEGVLDSEGRAHEWYILTQILNSKFNRKTIAFGSNFNKLVLQGGGEESERFLQAMTRIHYLMDELSAKAPKAMEKFPVLFDQISGFTSLQAMRDALIRNVEFSSWSGKVVAGSLLSEAERYHEILSQQSVQLKDAIKEFSKNKDFENSEILSNLVKDVNKLVSQRDLAYNKKRVQQLKAMAASNSNLQRLAIEENSQKLRELSGIPEIGNEVYRIEHGNKQIELITKGFKTRKAVAEEPFNELSKKYQDEFIEVGELFKNNPQEFKDLEPNLRSLFVNFGKLDPDRLINFKQKVTRDFFKRRIGFGPDDSISKPEDFDRFKEQIKLFINKNLPDGSPEQKLTVYETLLAKTNSLELAFLQNKRQVNYSQLVNQAAYDISNTFNTPTALNVPTLMEFRKELSDNAAAAFNSRNFDRYRELKLKVSQFDDVLQRSGQVGEDFVDDYRIARAKYADLFDPYLDEKGPFEQFANVRTEINRQPVTDHKLFQLFITGGDKKKNAQQFRKVFSNSEGEIDTEAVDELMFAITDHLVDGFNSVNATNLSDFITDTLVHFGPIIRSAGGKNSNHSRTVFLDTLEDLAVFHHSKTTQAINAREDVMTEIQEFIRQTNEKRMEVFQQSAVAQFGRPRSDKLNLTMQPIFVRVQDMQEQLLKRSVGDSQMGFNSYDNFLSQLRDSQEYANLKMSDPESLKDLETIVQSPNFANTFKQISDVSGDVTGKTVAEVILSDAKIRLEKGVLTQREYKGIKENMGILIEQDAMTHFFPYVIGTRRNFQDVDIEDVKLKNAIKEISKQDGRATSFIKHRFFQRSPDVLIRLRQKGVSSDTIRKETNLKQNYKFNLEYEYDPINAQNWWDTNGSAFRAVMGDEHADAFEQLMELGLITTKRGPEGGRVGDIPRDFSINQSAGRLYNTFAKRVVSPFYIAIEKGVVDYRVTQANIVRDLLSSKESAIFLKEIFAEGLFKPREARKYVRRLAFRLAEDGYKLRPEFVNEALKGLEESAIDTRKSIKEKAEEQIGTL